MVQTSPQTSLNSSQDFVRALKASTDPPVAHGLTKIEIAQEAWSNDSFYVPSKGEIIAEWILNKLLKDKGKESSVNPIFDARYWQLLYDICKTTDSATKGPDQRHVKTWLTPLLHRIPLGPVVMTFFISLSSARDIDLDALRKAFNMCIAILWPISVQKMSVEVLQECFGSSLLSVREDDEKTNSMIATSYRNSLGNSSNKKKLHQLFLQTYLQPWLQTLSRLGGKEIQPTILAAGTESIFNLDILRQAQDSKTDNMLIQHLQTTAKNHRDLVLEFLPLIFSHYMQTLKKHRGALFSQGSQSQPGAALDELRKTAMNFFALLIGLVGDREQDQRAWETRYLLLKLVDQENIYDPKQVGSQMTMNGILDLVVVTLTNGWKEEDVEQTTIAVQCLSTVTRIDYDLVSPAITRLLPRFLQLYITNERHLEFLDLLLAYHTKIRAMNTLVENIFGSISTSSGNARTFHGDARARYQLSFASPLMHTFFLDKLSKALRSFLTESQCPPMIAYVSDALKSTWERSSAMSGSKQKKNRDDMDVDASVDGDELATIYSLTARLASVVLSSLPTQALSAPNLHELRATLVDSRTDIVYYSVTKGLKALRKSVGNDSWAVEVCLAASLRFLYALNVSQGLALPIQVDEKVHLKLTELLERENVLPELILEVFRVMLYNLSVRMASNADEVLEHLLLYLEKNFTPSDVRWSGHEYHLTNGEPGKAESALAVMYMVVERWLPELDQLASLEQIQRWLKIILTIKFSLEGNALDMQPEQLLLRLLQSAEFWEFRNIRNVFLKLLNSVTGSLEPSVLAKKFKVPHLLECSSIYRLLLLFPMEYFSWQLLVDLSKRALVANSALGDRLMTLSEPGIGDTLVENQIVLRVFLKRVYGYVKIGGLDLGIDQVESVGRIVNELPEKIALNDSIKEAYMTATLDLWEIYLFRLLKASKKNGPEDVLKVLQDQLKEPFGKQRLSSLCFNRLVELLGNDFAANSVHEAVVQALGNLHAKISTRIKDTVTRILQANFSQGDLNSYVDTVTQWSSLLSLGKWLDANGQTGQHISFVSDKLISVILPSLQSHESEHRRLNGLCIRIFAILLQELEYRPEAERPQHLDIVVAVYIYLSDLLPISDRSEMDVHLCKTSRKMAAADYLHLLLFVEESLGSNQHDSRVLHLVHLASLLLREHPSHSLVYIQKFTTTCLSIFTCNSAFVEGDSNVRSNVLKMVAQHCSDQQAALRTQDASSIWLLLSKYLAPSQEHDDDADVDVFHKIISIMTSLIRLRRDLVVLSLPHLGLILRRLILSMRGCRQNLGAKQLAMVMNTQPRWVTAKTPLGADEARALGRLLESLTVKTTIRVPTSSASVIAESVQKAESLAKPFSKHAAYVLKAYVEAMNEPLCMMPLEVRKELKPGLFALCGMMNEHSRDALMVGGGLGDGGRAVLKGVWKEWEAQRYVGKG